MTVGKACKKCGGVFPATLEYFGPHKMGALGLHPRCRPCKKVDDAEKRAKPDQKARQKAWRDANKGYVKAYNEKYREAGYKSTDHVRAWRAANIDHARRKERDKMRAHRQANPDKYREIGRKSYRRNRDKAIARAVNAYRTNPAVNLKARIATRLRKMIRRDQKHAPTMQLLGYTRDELIRHLERQFLPGMTWDRLLAGEIHIDHIVPVRAFKIERAGDAEFRACWSLGNLRPMWARDNLSKSGKIVTLL